MNYGQLPVDLGTFELTSVPEMMFVQYMPIKMAGWPDVRTPAHLTPFNSMIGKVCCDYIGNFGLDKFRDSYCYITAKRMWQNKNNQYNREGWHSDGFMTDDINYIWSDGSPTIFNRSKFKLTQDDRLSALEMKQQARANLDMEYPNKSLLRLNQYVIHRVNPNPSEGMRTFVKISFSKDKYDLEGNAHNYEFTYNWPMRPRSVERNIPQGEVK